jgi:hypothetical protein
MIFYSKLKERSAPHPFATPPSPSQPHNLNP